MARARRVVYCERFIASAIGLTKKFFEDGKPTSSQFAEIPTNRIIVWVLKFMNVILEINKAILTLYLNH